MATTVIQADETEIPWVGSIPLIAVKQSWADDWVTMPELELVRATWASGNHDLSVCEFKRRFGKLRNPWDDEEIDQEPITLDRFYVAVALITEGQMETIFVGQVSSDLANTGGSENSPVGEQRFVAYGPLQMMRKESVSFSYWARSDVDNHTVDKMGWVPVFNSRGKHNLLYGNRTKTKSGGCYHFGGKEPWSYFEILEYVVYRLLTKYDKDGNVVGPKWWIAGQFDVLKNIREPVDIGDVFTIDELMNKLINPKRGLDWIPWFLGGDGTSGSESFAIFIFSLVNQPVTFRDSAFPVNGETVEVKISGSHKSASASFARSGDHTFGKVRILGKRMIRCCSLGGPKNIALVPKWSTAQGQAYAAGTGKVADSPVDHDHARKKESLKDVFQKYGPPANWGGVAAPKLDNLGNVIEGFQFYQTKVGAVLSWLPLRAGLDYTQTPAKDNNLTDAEPDFLKPIVWIQDPNTKRYILVDEAGMGVSVSSLELAFWVNASPNHRLALNHWYATNSLELPVYDYATLAITLAVETDQRLCLSWEPEDSTDDTVIEILDNTAELWYLSPETIVGVDDAGALQTIGSKPQIIRNDADKLAMTMAGTIARYYYSRCRAELVFKDLVAYTGLLGQVLNAVDAGGAINDVQAPITAVEWTYGEEVKTTVKTGYAK